METAPASKEPVAIKRAKDLDQPARAWLERLFRRPLRDEEDVTILVSAPHRAPDAATRKTAAAGLKRILDEAAANMQGIPPEEFDAAVDEAMRHVRPRYER